MLPRHGAVLVLLALLAFAFPAPLLASGSADGEYTKEINRGIAEFEERNFAEARAHFARAHELSPNARTYRALGMAEYELKNYAASAQLLEMALASQIRALPQRLREETSELLSQAQRYLGHVVLLVEPASASLRIDGAPAKWSPEQPVLLPVGDHLLDLVASGYATERRPVTILGGERKSLRISLHRLADGPQLEAADSAASAAAPVQSKPARKDEPNEARPLRKNPWLWTGLGVVIAGAAAGAAVALTRDPTTKTREPYTGTGGAPPLGAP
jgi:tetratricopeptide (TPR) repeat protein